MTVETPIWVALKRLERADLTERDRNLLRPAFAAMHGSGAIRVPEDIVALIRKLDAQLPKEAA